MFNNQPICDAGQAPAAVDAGRPRAAFTLVELMVVIVIIGILASLTLAGLAGVRQRAKIEKTKSTIRKINAVIEPMYESYLTRRVNVASSGPAWTPLALAAERLRLLRAAMMNEMPDTWAEADASSNTTLIASGFKPSATGVRYGRRCSQMSSQPNLLVHESAETLYLILALGGRYPDALENFRSDEIGDRDRDTAPEFLDGWGQPIRFRRWPVGFALVTGQAAAPDPFDPLRITADPPPPPPDPPPPSPYLGDPETYPLIFSCGPDDALEPPNSDADSGYAAAFDWLPHLERRINPSPPNWRSQIGWTFKGKGKSIFVPDTDPEKASKAEKARDNITNYDLLRK